MPFVPDWAFGSDAVFATLAAAFLIEAIAGGLPGLSRIFDFPAIFVRAVARFADRRLNRPMRSARSRRVRGALVLLFLLPVAALAGYAGASVCRTLPDGWAVEACLVAMCVGLQRPLVAGAAIRGALVRAGLERARKVLAGASGAETDAADVHGLARGSVELFAVRLCDGLVGPVFWYAVAGLPGLFVYRAVVAAADALAHPTPRYAAFGTAAAALDRLLNLVPAPLTGFLIFLGALFAPTAHPAAALRGMLAGAGLARLPREGWTMGAVAGALGLSLAGPRRFGGELSAAGWIGDGRARATPTDIARATWLYVITVFIALIPVALLALLVHRV
jgi:adenosylcobinamide-phosphate synthase